MNNFKSPTTIPTFDDPEFVYFYFTTRAVAIDRSVDLSALNNAIKTSVEEKWGLLNSEFYNVLDESTYQEFIREVQIDGKEVVKKHNTVVTLYNKYDLTSDTASVNLSIFPIESETITAFVKLATDSTWTKVATTDVSGNFVSISPFTIGGSINYNTGAGTFIYVTGLPNPITDYELKLEYSIVDPDIELNKRNQVLVMEAETNVITTLY